MNTSIQAGSLFYIAASCRRCGHAEHKQDAYATFATARSVMPPQCSIGFQPVRTDHSAPAPVYERSFAPCGFASLSSLVPMLDRLDRSRAIPGGLLVPDECELQPATAEQIPGLKRMTKAESASPNLHCSGRTIGSRRFELNLSPADHGENVICMLRNNSERVTRI